MEKENFTFTKEKALQEVGNLIEAFKEMKIVNLGNDTYNVIGVPVTNIEQEIQNAFVKAGNLLHCDAWRFENLDENEQSFFGVVQLCYVKAKKMDKQRMELETIRLNAMIKMGLYGEYGYVMTSEPVITHTDEYDMIDVTFYIGKYTES